MEDLDTLEIIKGKLDENGVLNITVTRFICHPINSITFTTVINKNGELEIN